MALGVIGHFEIKFVIKPLPKDAENWVYMGKWACENLAIYFFKTGEQILIDFLPSLGITYQSSR